jgi:hypothetical protein
MWRLHVLCLAIWQLSRAEGATLDEAHNRGNASPPCRGIIEPPYTQGRLQRRTSGARRCCTGCGVAAPPDRGLSSFILLHSALHKLSRGDYARDVSDVSPSSSSGAPSPQSRGSQWANGCAHASWVPLFFRCRIESVAQVPSRVVCSAGPSQHLLARLFYRSAIILHHAPRPSDRSTA